MPNKNGTRFYKGMIPWNKGIPNTWTKPPKAMYNEENPAWKGDEASYVAKHQWVTRRLGQPKKCNSCGLNDENRWYHWANVSGKYQRNINDWIRLCVPCHSEFDNNRRLS